jgi:hypothetical protein
LWNHSEHNSPSGCERLQPGRRFDGIIERRDVDELIGAVKELEAMLAATEMDVDFYEGVLDGSFDSSKDTLIRALGRIVQKEDES